MRLTYCVCVFLLGLQSGVSSAQTKSISVPREVILLSPIRMNSPDGVHKLITIDVLELLNKSKWRADKEPVPVSPKVARDLAIKSIPSNVQSRTEGSLTGISLKPYPRNILPDVWFYDVEFMPLNDSGGAYDYALMHVAIILMTGSVLIPRSVSTDELFRINNNRERCTYIEKSGKWERVGCK